jgi:hypothetical protein
MFSGMSQVVGVIEVDRPSADIFEDTLSPAVCTVAHVLAASDDDEVITADLRQLKRELRAELAFVLARLQKSR